MPSLLLQLLLRLFATALLLLIIFLSAWKAWRIWFDDRLVLTPFYFSENGEQKEPSGQAFIQLVSQDLNHIREMYSGRAVFEAPLLPSSDQLGRGEDISLPVLRTEVLPAIELEAYGVKVTRLLRETSRYLEQPSTIVGSVSKRATGVAVHAELVTPALTHAAHPTASWDVRYAADVDAASFELSAKVLLHLMRSRSAFLSQANEADFTAFTRALESYELYQVRLREFAAREITDKPLAEAERLVTPLITSPNRFPLALKVAGYIAKEKGDLAAAKQYVDQYLSRLATYQLADTSALEFRERLIGRPAETATRVHDPEPPSSAKGTRSISPGLSIGVTGGGAGTVCCLVQDGSGKKYLLSAQHILGDKANVVVLQPAPMDGGDSKDAVADTVAAPGSIGTVANHGAFAFAAIRPQVRVIADIPKLGPIAGIATTVTAGQRLRIAGRTSGVLEGEVRAVRVDATIQMPTGPTTFQDLIETTKLSAPGDSGAPVLTTDNQLVGMVFAGSQFTTYVIPLEPLLRAGGLHLVR